jgi:hypothetical protein
MKKMLVIMLAVVAGLAAVAVMSGCDSAEGIDGISLSPASVTLSGGTNAVAFSAQTKSALALPLEWSVSDGSLGFVTRSSGSNAVYTANRGKTGTQVISVRDQYGNEGFASVVQQ